MDFLNVSSIFTELSHVVQVQAEGPKAPSSGHMVPKWVFSIQYSVFFAIVTLSMVINYK